MEQTAYVLSNGILQKQIPREKYLVTTDNGQLDLLQQSL